MSNIEKFFVRGFIKFLNKQIQEKSSEQVESLEVAVQCLESCFELNQDEDTANPLNNVDLFELFTNSVVTVNPDRKADAEQLKNDGNRLMKEEKYQEALNAYGRWVGDAQFTRHNLNLSISVPSGLMQRIQFSTATELLLSRELANTRRRSTTATRPSDTMQTMEKVRTRSKVLAAPSSACDNVF